MIYDSENKGSDRGKRTSFEITRVILKELKERKRAKKTWLQNSSGLNSKNFEKYFVKLIEKEYIAPHSTNGPYYVITYDGLIYLEKLLALESNDISEWINISKTSQEIAEQEIKNIRHMYM